MNEGRALPRALRNGKRALRNGKRAVMNEARALPNVAKGPLNIPKESCTMSKTPYIWARDPSPNEIGSLAKMHILSRDPIADYTMSKKPIFWRGIRNWIPRQNVHFGGESNCVCTSL